MEKIEGKYFAVIESNEEQTCRGCYFLDEKDYMCTLKSLKTSCTKVTENSVTYNIYKLVDYVVKLKNL